MTTATATELTVVSTGGARIHVRIDGAPDAPTVVLAHGWTCNTAFWDGVCAHLADGHRVVRYDQRGHGRTPATPRACSPEALADDLCAVLEETVPRGGRAVVGGHSMGAMTIVAAAGRAAFEERAAAAMLCSTGMGRLNDEARVVPFRSVALRRPLQKAFLGSRLPMGPVTPMTERVLGYVTLGSGASPALRRQVAEMVQACGRRPRAEWGAVLSALELTDRLERLAVPTAVVHGTADRLTPLVHAHRMAERLPECDGPVLLPGLGHMTPMEDPERVAEVLRGLVAGHLAPAGPEKSAARRAAPKTRKKKEESE